MLERPNFALNPARSILARGTDFRSVALWPFDREVDSPWCTLDVEGVSLLGLHFASDDELWTFTTDGKLTAWSLTELLANPPEEQSPNAAADASDDEEGVDDEESATDDEEDATDAAGDDEAGTDDEALETAEPSDPSAGARQLWQIQLNATFSAFEAAKSGVALGDVRGRVWWIESTGGGARVFAGGERHYDAVVALAFSPDESLLASSGRDRRIRIWRRAGGEGLSESSVVTADDVVEFFVDDFDTGDVSPSEVLDFFSVAESDEAADSPQPEADGPQPEADGPQPEADSPPPEADSPQPEADSPQPEADTPEPTGNRPSTLESVRIFRGMDGWQLAMAFSSTGSKLATGGMDHGVYRWDLDADEDRPANVQFAHSGWVADVEWSPDDEAIATASWDCTIGLFDGETLEPRLCLELHRDYVSDVEFFGDRLVAGSHDHEISTWDWREGRLGSVLVGHVDWVEAVVPLSARELASVGSDGTARVWDLEREELLRTIGRVDGAGIELGSAVGFSDYVDTTELASYGVSGERSPRSRYRNYRASGFRSGAKSTAIGLLEGALGSEVSPSAADAPARSLLETSSVAEPSAEFIETAAPRAEDESAEIAQSELDVEAFTSAELPQLELDAPDITGEPGAQSPEPRAERPEPEAPEPEAPEPEASEPAAQSPEPRAERPEPEAPEPEAPEPEAPEPEAPEPEAPEPEAPEPEAPEPEAPEPEPEEQAEPTGPKTPDPGPPDTDDWAPMVEDADETVEMERSDGTFDTDSTGDEETETSVAGPGIITSYDAGDSLEALTMSLAGDSTARLESNDPPEEFEPVSDPPSEELPGELSVSSLAEPSVDEGWDILEQTVDASVFGTEKWRESSRVSAEPLADESSPEDWIREGSINDSPPEIQHDETERKTREVPTESVMEVVNAAKPDVTDTEAPEIWERLPSRSTPTKQILRERARIGSTSFEASHTIRTPHEFVYSVAVAPDGERIATCGGDDSVCIWTKEGDLVHRMTVQSDGLNAIGFSFDGRAVVAGGDDSRVHLWLLPTKDESVIRHAPLRGHDGWISSVAFSDEGSFVMSGSYDGTVRVWKLSTGQCVRTLVGHDGAVTGVAIGKTRAYSVGHDGALSVWNQKWVQVDLLSGHDRLLGVSSNGELTAFCAANGEVFLVRSGRAVPLLRHRGQARAVKVRGDGAIFSAGEDGNLRIYPPESESPSQSLVAGSPLWCVDASAKMICAGADDGFVHVFQDNS